MRAKAELIDGIKNVKLGQVLRTCSIGNIRLEKVGRMPRTVKIGHCKYIIGAIECKGNVITEGLIGELLCWDTSMQPFSLDGYEDVIDDTVDIGKHYKALDRWVR